MVPAVPITGGPRSLITDGEEASQPLLYPSAGRLHPDTPTAHSSLTPTAVATATDAAASAIPALDTWPLQPPHLGPAEFMLT